MKFLKILIALLLIIIIACVGLYFYLPTLIVKSVTTDDKGIQVVPVEVKAKINNTVDELPTFLEEMDMRITIDDIIEVLDKMTVKEITTTLNKLNNTTLTSEKQVVQIVGDNINFYQLDTEKNRKIVLEHLKLNDVQKALKMARENGKPYALTIPLAKETIKQLLIEKKKKIEAELN